MGFVTGLNGFCNVPKWVLHQAGNRNRPATLPLHKQNIMKIW